MRWLPFSLSIVVGVVLFSGCGGNDAAVTMPQNVTQPYADIHFDAQGVATVHAQADDAVVVYRTGVLESWPTVLTSPPYEPISVAPTLAQALTRWRLRGGPFNDADGVSRAVPLADTAKPARPHGARAITEPQWQVGDVTDFVFDEVNNVNTAMQLCAIGQHGYIWVDLQLLDYVTPDQVQAFTTAFDDAYAFAVNLFGYPCDIDRDPRLHVCVAFFSGGSFAGAFNPQLVEFNQRDMLMIDANSARDPKIITVLAHELHHAIWWWAKGDGGLRGLNEGMSTLANFLRLSDWSNTTEVGYYTSYLQNPQAGSMVLTAGRFMYGSQGAFAGYLYDRFGPAWVKVYNSGSPRKDSELLRQTTGLTPERLMVDWAVAQLISSQTKDPRYQITTLPLHGTYRGVVIPPLKLLPMDGTDTTGGCRPWGFCYYRAAQAGTYTIAVGNNADFHAVLVPGGAKGW
jgi:hypothetical protein